jgi:hypothetical protein
MIHCEFLSLCVLRFCDYYGHRVRELMIAAFDDLLVAVRFIPGGVLTAWEEAEGGGVFGELGLDGFKEFGAGLAADYAFIALAGEEKEELLAGGHIAVKSFHSSAYGSELVGGLFGYDEFVADPGVVALTGQVGAFAPGGQAVREADVKLIMLFYEGVGESLADWAEGAVAFGDSFVEFVGVHVAL